MNAERPMPGAPRSQFSKKAEDWIRGALDGNDSHLICALRTLWQKICEWRDSGMGDSAEVTTAQNELKNLAQLTPDDVWNITRYLTQIYIGWKRREEHGPAKWFLGRMEDALSEK